MKAQMNILIEKKDLDLVKKVASKRGERHSDFVIISIRKELARLGFLTSDEKKALGSD